MVEAGGAACQTPYHAQDSPPQQEMTRPQMPIMLSLRTSSLEQSWLVGSAGCVLGGGGGGGGWPKLSGVLSEEAEPGMMKGEVSGNLTIVPKGSKHKRESAGGRG